jgi:polar amino acid transport system ATP-binding protein
VLCIVGPSGSGKSTFLRCINQLERADKGAIWVDGELSASARRRRAARALGQRARAAAPRLRMVFQRFNLFTHMTALQNIIEGPVTVQRGRATKSIDEAMRCSSASALPRSATLTRPTSPAASSSGWRSHARWR